MKIRNNIILFFLLITINLSGQIVYDTIPDDEYEIGGHYWDELFIFRDFENQALAYFDKVDFKKLNCYGGRVFVSTIFSENGELKNTSIVKSASPICDSIAFDFVSGLKDWLPGMVRGKFVDIPFVFPIRFDSLEIKDRFTKTNAFFNVTESEFSKRKEYFDFFYSNSSRKVVNDFTYFYKFLAEKLSSDSLYIYCREYNRPRKSNSVKIKLNNENTDSLNFIIYYPDNPRFVYYILAKERWIFFWDKPKWQITPNFTPAKKNGVIYLEKDKKTILIGFVRGKEEPKLAIYNDIIFKNDTILHLDFELYHKNDILNEVKYSP